jgi:large exoprotein involved in heme utilization and adhesion
MALTDHATLSATSTGTGDAGNIAVVIGNSLRLQDSAITTAATRADGGNISITTTGSQVFLSNGRITTSVQSGIGGGGNITLGTAAHPIEFLILNGSEIRADAFGGPGGNINIFAGTFLTSNSILSASSALGVPGTIGIQAGITNVSSVVGQLPESVLQAATLLRAACATRLAGGQSSSLVVSGREGLPAEPGGALPSPLVAEGPADSGLSLDEGGGHDDLSNRIALWVPAPRCLR